MDIKIFIIKTSPNSVEKNKDLKVDNTISMRFNHITKLLNSHHINNVDMVAVSYYHLEKHAHSTIYTFLSD